MILLKIGSWWLASEFTPGPTLAVANGFSFAEIDSDIVVDLLNSNEEYAALSEQMSVMRKQHPFILNLDEGDGAITLSAEEHETYLAYIGLMHQTEDMERLQIYFRGHTDAVAYLKKNQSDLMTNKAAGFFGLLPCSLHYSKKLNLAASFHFAVVGTALRLLAVQILNQLANRCDRITISAEDNYIVLVKTIQAFPGTPYCL